MSNYVQDLCANCYLIQETHKTSIFKMVGKDLQIHFEEASFQRSHMTRFRLKVHYELFKVF